MNELQSLLKDLYLISGFNMTMFDIDENVITSYPCQDSPFCRLIKSTPKGALKCKECDHAAFERVKKTGKIDIYNCSLHLYEAVVPLYTYGVHTGYLMMGQTLTNSDYEKQLIKNEALKYVKDDQKLDDAIEKISFHTREKILSFAAIIDICGKYLTLTNRVEAKNRNLAMETKQYIMINYANEITIDDLCQYFYCSKSTLHNKFKEEYGITIHQYILEYRLEKALELLKNNKNSILEIALNCGFNDANYFSKAFKKKYKVSPSVYRENI